MGQRKSKRVQNFTIGRKGNSDRYIHYISLSNDYKSLKILARDKETDSKIGGRSIEIDIPIEQAIMTKAINMQRLSMLIDKHSK